MKIDFRGRNTSTRWPHGLVLGVVSLLIAPLLSPQTFGSETDPSEPNPAETVSGENEPTDSGSGNPSPIPALVPWEDPPERLEPVNPEPEQAKSARDAQAWFAVGRVRESRNDFRQALDAYRKAIELAPQQPRYYKSLVPLAFSLNESEMGLKYALQLVELDPSDFRLLRQLGTLMAARNDIEKAIDLLEKAAEVDGVDHLESPYVLLQRDLGVLYQATDDLAKAADSFEIVLEALTRPELYRLNLPARAALLADAESTFEKMGDLFVTAERYESAIKAFEEADRARRGRPAILKFNVARIYEKTNKHNEALAAIEEYIKSGSTERGAAAYELFGQILKSLEREDEIVGRLQSIADKSPRNAAVRLTLADLLIEQDRLDDASQILGEIAPRESESQVHFALARIAAKRNDAAVLLSELEQATSESEDLQSLAEFLKSISENESLLASLVKIGRERVASDDAQLSFRQSYLLAKLAREAEQVDEAVEFYQVAMASAGERELVIAQEFADYLQSNDQLAEAADVLAEALKSANAEGPARAQLLFRRSEILESAGRTEEAIKSISDALTILPGNPTLEFQRAWIYSHARRDAKAVQLFREFINAHPEAPPLVRQAKFILSNVLVRSGQLDEGVQVLEEVYENDPDDPSVNNDLGYLYADQGIQLEKALKMAKLAVESEPDNAAYLDTLGWALFKLGRFEEAVKHLSKAVTFESGQDAVLYDHLGDAQSALGNTDAAEQAWQKALDFAEKQSVPDPELIGKLKSKLNTES
ncbi:tetratricopeptide repeat protein [Stratiformator vulcanicus]|uniref:Cellulose synthase subunit BcsC n=1 Tax=Stratiformator vulcanicus TaxID=2527980 RepID=A0A517R4Y9_9PLAN|nr:tetratricopeptide repeat protein [Stratiformator vulcanicus]QDT38883.1 cellulose synthase subunit BcsC [Stratiformator vulcanicus]